MEPRVWARPPVVGLVSLGVLGIALGFEGGLGPHRRSLLGVFFGHMLRELVPILHNVAGALSE